MFKKHELKKLRSAFRENVFARDDHTCVMCMQPAVDAHHVTGRDDMPNGGYAIENSVSLCASCHVQAELYLNGKSGDPMYMPDELYRRIGSSYEIALAACDLLRR